MIYAIGTCFTDEFPSPIKFSIPFVLNQNEKRIATKYLARARQDKRDDIVLPIYDFRMCYSDLTPIKYENAECRHVRCQLKSLVPTEFELEISFN